MFDKFSSLAFLLSLLIRNLSACPTAANHYLSSYYPIRASTSAPRPVFANDSNYPGPSFSFPAPQNYNPTTPTAPTSPSWTTCGVSKYMDMQMDGNGEIGGRLVGGVNVAPSELPWMAFLEIYNRGSGRKEMCAGSVIDNDWILTSAQCCIKANFMPKDITVKLGGNNIYGFLIQTSCSRIIVHPSYNMDTLYNYDFCLLQLPAPVSFSDDRIKPICVPDTCDQTCQSGDMATISGWGSISIGGPTSPNLLKANVPIVSSAICQQSYRGITDKMICAGYFTDGGVDTCTGDGGSPLQCKKNGHYTIDGVASFGKGCALAGYPGVYSRVCTITPWIDLQIGYSNIPNNPPSTSFELPFTTPFSTPFPYPLINITTPGLSTTTTTPFHNYGLCGIGAVSPNAGPFASPGEFPWHVFLYIYMRNLQTYTYCGGVYIKQSWILTPAHCCRHAVQPSDITVDFGLSGSSSLSVSFSAGVLAFVTHPQYNSDAVVNDFCLVKVNLPQSYQSPTSIVPICLPDSCESTCQTSDVAVVNTWSSVQLGALRSAMLEKFYLPIYPAILCQNGLGSRFGENKTCTAPSSGPCTGDEGSVLACNKHGLFTIAGIVASGSCSYSSAPLLFHEVCKVRPWINQITSN